MTGTARRRAVWTLETRTVESIWETTARVLGNKLWPGDVEGALRADPGSRHIATLEVTAGRTLADCLQDAVDGMERGTDPSTVLASVRREFDGYGVDLRFAEHPRYGDVLARAERLEVDEGPSMAHHLDAATVAAIWDGVRDEDIRPEEWFDADFCHDLELEYDGDVAMAVEDVLASVPADADPSLFFRALRRFSAEYGIDLRFAPHPTYGDVLERASQLDD